MSYISPALLYQIFLSYIFSSPYYGVVSSIGSTVITSSNFIPQGCPGPVDLIPMYFHHLKISYQSGSFMSINHMALSIEVVSLPLVFHIYHCLHVWHFPLRLYLPVFPKTVTDVMGYNPYGGLVQFGIYPQVVLVVYHLPGFRWETIF